MYTRLIEYRPPRIAMALVAVAAALHVSLPLRWSYLASSTWLAVALAATGFAIMMIAWLQFRKHEVAVCPTAPTVFLITDGVYRWTRNPMYLGMVLMLAGVSVLFGTMPFYAATVLFFIVLDRWFCRYEEAKLASVFGQLFLQYRSRVRRWI